MALHGPHWRSYFSDISIFQGLPLSQRNQYPKSRHRKHTQTKPKIETDNPQPHFQKKREAEEAAENSSSLEESSDLSEAEAAVEGDNMDAEGQSNF